MWVHRSPKKSQITGCGKSEGSWDDPQFFESLSRWIFGKTRFLNSNIVKHHRLYDVICMIWYDMIWYDMIWYDMIWFDMIWYICMCVGDWTFSCHRCAHKERTSRTKERMAQTSAPQVVTELVLKFRLNWFLVVEGECKNRSKRGLFDASVGHTCRFESTKAYKTCTPLLAVFDYDLGETRAACLLIKQEAALNSLST